MTIIIKKKNLFDNYGKTSVFAHCISSDFKLGAGIAKDFDRIYSMSHKLNQTDKKGIYPCCIKINNVYNLVTKEYYYNKPTYKNLELSLQSLKQQMVSNKETELFIPKIGCGLDKLDWKTVQDILIKIFKDTSIDITVCVL